jgi:hypothetical protein
LLLLLLPKYLLTDPPPRGVSWARIEWTEEVLILMTITRGGEGVAMIETLAEN